MGAYLIGPHPSAKTTPQIQFRGFRTYFGALVKGHPSAWVHISLGSTVPPKLFPKSSFGGLKLILGTCSGSPLAWVHIYFTGFHCSTKSTPQIQFWGFKTDFGALVKGHPFAWVHIPLGSTILPQPPPKSSFGGLKLILGHL